MDNNYRLPRINLIEFLQMKLIHKFRKSMELALDHIEFTSGNISFFELIALVSIVKQFEPAVLMEFGTFNGRTTLNLALNTDGVVYTVDLPPKKEIETKFPLADGVHDPNNELGFIGLDTSQKFFHSFPHLKIWQLWMDTATIPINIYKNRVDFLFVDASHSYENCLNDSDIAHAIVKEGGVIAWHDYNGWPGVTKAINEFSESHNWMRFYWLHDTSIVVTVNQKLR